MSNINNQKFWLVDRIGRDHTFCMLYNKKYCVFAFEENYCEKLSICILCSDGNLHWTYLDNTTIPDEYLYDNQDLAEKAGNEWLKNYNGTY